MKTLYIIVTDQCQMRCPFCYVNFVPSFDNNLVSSSETPKNVSHIDPELVYKVIKKGEYDLAVFHGGEPLLYPQVILDIMDRCKDLNVNFSIQSNLAFKQLSPKQLEAISRLNSIGTSYSYDRFAHCKQQELYFISNVKELKSIGIGVSSLITVTESQINYQNPYALKDYIDELGVDQIHFERVIMPLKELEEDKVRLEVMYKEIDKYLRTCYEIFPKDKTTLYTLVRNSIVYRRPFYDTACSNHTHTLYPDKLKYGCPTLEKRNVVDTKMDKCLKCRWFKWCGGDCECFNHVCAFPSLLFERVIKDLKQEMKEETLLYGVQ